MQKVNNIIIQLLGLVLIAVLAVWYLSNAVPVQGSATFGNDYNATTTVRTTGVANLKNLQVLKLGYGSLGSVVITGAGTGTMYLYDATSTTNAINTEWATTTLAIIPASSVANTYVFDVSFSKGLLIEYAGAIATSTITFR